MMSQVRPETTRASDWQHRLSVILLILFTASFIAGNIAGTCVSGRPSRTQQQQSEHTYIVGSSMSLFRAMYNSPDTARTWYQYDAYLHDSCVTNRSSSSTQSVCHAQFSHDFHLSSPFDLTNSSALDPRALIVNIDTLAPFVCQVISMVFVAAGIFHLVADFDTVAWPGIRHPQGKAAACLALGFCCHLAAAIHISLSAMYAIAYSTAVQADLLARGMDEMKHWSVDVGRPLLGVTWTGAGALAMALGLTVHKMYTKRSEAEKTENGDDVDLVFMDACDMGLRNGEVLPRYRVDDGLPMYEAETSDRSVAHA